MPQTSPWGCCVASFTIGDVCVKYFSLYWKQKSMEVQGEPDYVMNYFGIYLLLKNSGTFAA